MRTTGALETFLIFIGRLSVFLAKKCRVWIQKTDFYPKLAPGAMLLQNNVKFFSVIQTN